MARPFARIAFTPSVKQEQEANASRSSYARWEDGELVDEPLADRERDFIAHRDSFYLASVSETGWPYVQHRGGPRGFIKVLDERTIGFADFRGNRQYVSVGNLRHEVRVALILVDYATRTRLKLLGRARFVSVQDPVLARLAVPSYRARIERGVLIEVAAFDWNCPQHITQRYTVEEIESQTAPLRNRIAELEAALQAARSQR